MNSLVNILKPVFGSMLLMLLMAGFAVSAEIDDTAIFVEAFTAFQKKDYLLAIEKIAQMQQQFPDTPLRDVALLLQARAGFKAGDNELAAKSINQFQSEFSGNTLRTTIEDELLALGARLQKGEALPPNQQLKAAAQKIKNDRLAVERAVVAKLEQERLAREKAERDRVAREKAEIDRRERERVAVEKAAKDAVKVAVSIPGGAVRIQVGETGQVGFEVVNKGKNREEFLIGVDMPPEFDPSIVSAAKTDETVSRLLLAPGEVFKGRVLLRMPADMVDGQRKNLVIRAVSAKFADVIQTRQALLITAAPLVRVVAKPVKTKVVAGELIHYRVTALNIGSLVAEGLTLRLQLPPQLDFQAAPEAVFRQEKDGTLVFRVDRIETGSLVEFNLDVKVRDDSRAGQELRGQVELINGRLQRKEIFNTAAAVVQSR